MDEKDVIPYLQGGGITGALATLAYVGIWLRRRLSNDNLAIKREGTEGDLLDIVLRERNEAIADAKKAWELQREDAKEIGRLSAQVEGLRELNHKLNNEVHLLRLQLISMRRELRRFMGEGKEDETEAEIYSAMEARMEIDQCPDHGTRHCAECGLCSDARRIEGSDPGPADGQDRAGGVHRGDRGPGDPAGQR